MKTEIIMVETSELLDELYDNSSLTLCGLSLNSVDDFLEWIDNLGGIINWKAYVISGKLLNEYCGCTGDNMYPFDLNIVCVKLDDIKDVDKIIMPRFEIGGRWFDDVVDNNRRSG